MTARFCAEHYAYIRAKAREVDSSGSGRRQKEEKVAHAREVAEKKRESARVKLEKQDVKAEHIRNTVLVRDVEMVKKMKVAEIDAQLAYLRQSDKAITAKSSDRKEKKLADQTIEVNLSWKLTTRAPNPPY